MTGWTTAAAGVCVTKRKYVERFSHSSASSPSFHWSPERHSKTAWCSPPRHRTLHHRVNTPLRAPPFTKSHRSPALARRYPADSRRLLPWCHRLGRINRESATNGSKRNIQEGGGKKVGLGSLWGGGGGGGQGETDGQDVLFPEQIFRLMGGDVTCSQRGGEGGTEENCITWLRPWNK